jgi:hypothetical protein
MKKKLLFALVLFLFIPLLLSSPETKSLAFSGIYAPENNDSDPQSVKKPKFYYMSSILSRNTKPLGLIDNLTLRKFLNQPSIKWALRSGGKHILN